MDGFYEGLHIFMLAIVPALFGIICHEVAHGLIAYRLGDPTAKMMGRLTLNPVKHIDPTGLGVFAFTALVPQSPFIFGWAKPVPVQAGYFRSPRQGMILVSLAGPMANFLVAILCALILKLALVLYGSGLLDRDLAKILIESMGLGISINCALAWFNLLPVPPLDGGHILGGFLPRQLYLQYVKLERFGLILLLVLLASGVLGTVIVPLIKASAKVIRALVGI